MSATEPPPPARAAAAPALRAQVGAQRATLAGARSALAGARAARDAAAADLRSLEYVSGLTRDEAARRRSGNERVLAAPRARGGGGGGGCGGLQEAEAALLAAKAELAALRLTVDALGARAGGGAGRAHAAGRAARSDARTTPRAAPRTPPASFARLIADVDVVVAAAGAAAAAAPARLGVTPAGNVALFGYHSADPVHRFSTALRVSAPVPLAEQDERRLKLFLDAAPVHALDLAAPHPSAAPPPGNKGGGAGAPARLCGFGEALRAAAAVVNAASAAPKVFEEPLPPMSPRRGGRTFL